MKWSIAQATVLSYYSRRRFELCARILVFFERESFFTLTRVCFITYLKPSNFVDITVKPVTLASVFLSKTVYTFEPFSRTSVSFATNSIP